MVKSESLIDIIIVNYNSTDYLLDCLRSVYDSQQEFPVRVVVQDNASEDGIDRVVSAFPEAILVKNSNNIGFAKAVNKGMKESTAPYVILLNPDSCVTANFFGRVLEYIEKHPDVGILGPEILDSNGSVQGSARSFPTPFTGLFGRNSILTKCFPNNRISRENILTTRCDGISPMEVDWVSGACMVVRRRAVDDVGPLDEGFFMYWEDADWCRRMWQKGWKVVYFPQATVIHHVGGSSAKRPIRSIVEFHKSCYRLFNKYKNPSLWFVNPFVIGAIAPRLVFALFINRMGVWSNRIQSLMRAKVTSAISRKKDKIKVLRIITRLNIGGPAIHVKLLTNGLDANKFRSTLATGTVSPQEGDMGYLFDSLNNKPVIIPELEREINFWKDLKTFRQIFNLLHQEKPDIVHTHTAKAGFSARLAVFLYNLIYGKKIRTVHTFHGHVFKSYFSKITSEMFIFVERLLSKLTNVIIAISKTQKKELIEKYRIASPDKVKKVELGFDLKPFLENKALKGRFRRIHGIDDDTLLIGIIGRLVPIKNHLMFFKAAKIFLEQNPETRVKFIVVGDGELREELEVYCQKQGLSNYVRFCGWVKEVPLIYADLDILAMTSLNEGTHVSIIEAMASSVPVIATNAGGVMDLLGTPDLISPTCGFMVCDRGILCRKNDPASFAKGLRYMVMAGSSEREGRIKRARSFVEKRFDQKRLIHDMESLYVELMA